MKRQEIYIYISEKMGMLSSVIKTNSRLNLLDMNIHAENFFKELLNLIYDYNLINMNQIEQNFEAIDLIDEANEIMIQVTSTNTAQKVNATLSKEMLKKYLNCTLNFLFITGDTHKLVNKTFVNKFEIKFEPKINIWDNKKILDDILSLEIAKQYNLYDFFKLEFGEKPSVTQINSSLAEIVNALSNQEFEETKEMARLNEYDVRAKIEYNDLTQLNTIDECKEYMGAMNKIYEIFDEQGTMKKKAVFSKITSFYEKEMVKKDISNTEKFINIIDGVVRYVKQSGNLLQSIDGDVVDFCCRIIVVDAFIRCKIFENPEGYNYVVAN